MTNTTLKKYHLLAQKRQHARGFTLVEMLVVIGISAVLLTSASTFIISLLLSDTRRTSISVLNQQGNLAINQIEFLLRNAVSLESVSEGYPSCPVSSNQLSFRSLDGFTTTVGVENNRIASVSASRTPNAQYLTSADIGINSLLFSCQQGEGAGNTSVRVELEISKSDQAVTGEVNSSAKFQTTVLLRNL